MIVAIVIQNKMSVRVKLGKYARTFEGYVKRSQKEKQNPFATSLRKRIRQTVRQLKNQVAIVQQRSPISVRTSWSGSPRAMYC